MIQYTQDELLSLEQEMEGTFSYFELLNVFMRWIDGAYVRLVEDSRLLQDGLLRYSGLKLTVTGGHPVLAQDLSQVLFYEPLDRLPLYIGVPGLEVVARWRLRRGR